MSSGAPLCMYYICPGGRVEDAVVGVGLYNPIKKLLDGPPVVVRHQFSGRTAPETLFLRDIVVVQNSERSSGVHSNLQIQHNRIKHVGQAHLIIDKFIAESRRCRRALLRHDGLLDDEDEAYQAEVGNEEEALYDLGGPEDRYESWEYWPDQ